MKCDFCEFELKNNIGYANHVRAKHPECVALVPTLGSKIRICEYCKEPIDRSVCSVSNYYKRKYHPECQKLAFKRKHPWGFNR